MAASLVDQVNAIGSFILQLSNPHVSPATRTSVTASLPVMRFHEAALLAAGYLLMVAYGWWVMPRAKKGGSSEAVGPVRSKKYGGEGGDEVKKTVAQKFADEPILYVQFLYNWLQVALCGYMMVTAARVAMSRKYTLLCNSYQDTPVDRELVNVLWLFYVSKILDFADTLFMIVRGHWVQFTFLHTYHHTSIFLIYWAVTSSAYDGDVYYTIVANSFIHFIMYAYYGLTTINMPYIRNFSFVITYSQLFQFVTMMFQAVVILTQGCQYPKNITVFYLFYILSLFILFYNFLVTKNAKQAKEKK